MKLESISKCFPLPRFLKPLHVGISFSDSNIKAISFDRNLAKPRLNSVVVPIEKDSIVAGNILNMDEVVKKLFVVRKSFDSPFAFFTIPDELAYIFSISIPISLGGNATESIAFTIEENVPLSLADTVFDFTPIKVIQTESEHNASFVVAACVKDGVEKFVTALSKSGFESVGCIHESQAIASALVPENFPGTLCVVHARENRVGIYLIKDNTVHFSTLRSILGNDYKSQFLDEYEKFLEYYLKYNQNQNEPIKSIFVCGQFESAKETVEAALSSKGYIKDIKLGNVWTNVLKIEESTPDISYEDSLNLAGPIGAVLSPIL